MRSPSPAAGARVGSSATAGVPRGTLSAPSSAVKPAGTGVRRSGVNSGPVASSGAAPFACCVELSILLPPDSLATTQHPRRRLEFESGAGVRYRIILALSPD
jgi:hypothetical protein